MTGEPGSELLQERLGAVRSCSMTRDSYPAAPGTAAWARTARQIPRLLRHGHHAIEIRHGRANGPSVAESMRAPNVSRTEHVRDPRAGPSYHARGISRSRVRGDERESDVVVESIEVVLQLLNPTGDLHRQAPREFRANARIQIRIADQIVKRAIAGQDAGFLTGGTLAATRADRNICPLPGQRKGLYGGH